MKKPADILFTRRSFLTLSSMSIAALMLGNISSAHRNNKNTNQQMRRLVVLEMNGGNDGLNTVIPYGDGKYYDLRKRIAIRESKVLPLNTQWGLHPSLVKLKKRFDNKQVAIVQGIGYPDAPDLSHFAMGDVWRSGHPGGFNQTEQTGWQGRILEAIGNNNYSIGGFTVSTSVSQTFYAHKDLAVAAKKVDDGLLNFPQDLTEIMRRAITGLGANNDNDKSLLNVARKGLAGSLPNADLLASLKPSGITYPETETGQALSLAAQVLAANDNIRIVHVPLPLDFDSHVDQLSLQTYNLSEIDAALEVFLQELEKNGLADSTLVVTTSEFGRRVSDNGGNGTDHGSANAHFIIGKNVRGGLYGEAPTLKKLDNNGNLIPTCSFQDLLATVTEGWMNVEANQVLSGGRKFDLFL